MADDTNTVDPVVESRAREMGWRPKDEFKGDDAKWVDATTYVDRGEHVLPIIKETNNRLREDLIDTNNRLKQVNEALAASQETIKALEKYHQEDVKQKVETARADLKAQLIAAKKAGDVEAEVNLTDELTTLNAAEATRINEDKTTTTTTTQTTQPRDFLKDPVFIAWKEDNPWFGSDTSKTAIAYQVSHDLRASGDTSTGRDFLNKIALGTSKELARLTGRPAESKVEAGKGGAGGNNGGSNGRGKTYADLPPEAKKACDGYVRDLVGPNRRYATEAEWQKSYATQFFAEV